MGTANINYGSSAANARSLSGKLRFLEGDFTFGEDYTRGGEEFDLKPYFMRGILGVMIPSQNDYIFEYTGTTIRARVANTGAEVAEDADISHVGNVAEVQKIDFSHADGGDFKLEDSEGDKTAAIAHDVDASTLKSRIESLDEIEQGVTVEGENGEFTILYEPDEGASGVFVSEDDMDLTDSGDPTDSPEIEETVPFVERGVKFIAWGY